MKKNNKYYQVDGVFRITRNGHVFRPDLKSVEEISVPESLASNLIDGDRIRVDFKTRSITAATMVAIELLKRNREVIATFIREGLAEPLHEVGVVEVKVKNKTGVVLTQGDVVLLQLYKPQSKDVVGDIIQVLSDKTKTALEAELILREFDIPTSWSKQALQEAEKASRQDVSTLIKGREDFREVSFVTIDGENSRDFDDAIFCESVGKGWRILIAIADVASYVKAGSHLDEEAFERGNSVYLPGLVVPMLPAALSDQACSLRPNEDKLTLVCQFMLSPEGEIGDYEFKQAIIRSQARLNYSEVGSFFSGKKSLSGYPAKVAAMLREAHKAYQVMSISRKRRKTLDFDTVETRILFDADGAVRGLVPIISNDAHHLIEEFMIGANVCAARFISKHGKEMLFRAHGGLKKDSVRGLKNFIGSLGLSLRGIQAADLADLLESVEPNSKKRAVQTMILRSLSRALYQPENIGHFGLALDQYGHFTSPIRRYPDLIIHRILHKLLRLEGGRFYFKKRLKRIGEHCSITERRADSAVYNFEKYLKCIYACEHVGTVFSGVVTEITNFGLFIELDDLYIEGLLHVSSLGSDYYVFDEENRRLVGERSGRVYSLFDNISVVLAKSIPEARRIDFSLPGVRTHKKRKHKR